jgi:hypothetical protein
MCRIAQVPGKVIAMDALCVAVAAVPQTTVVGEHPMKVLTVDAEHLPAVAAVATVTRRCGAPISRIVLPAGHINALDALCASDGPARDVLIADDSAEFGDRVIGVLIAAAPLMK